MPRFWFIISLLIALISDSALATLYNQLDTAHFSFFYSLPDRKTAEHLSRQAELTRQSIIADLGVTFEAKTKVYIAASRQEFQQLQPQGSQAPTWAGALAYPGLNLIILNSPLAIKGQQQDILISFKHELTHIVIGRAFKGQRAPRWLNEGLAMYESREWELDRISQMTRAVLTHSLIPLRELIHDFPLEPEAAALAYDQSFYLVSYLLTKQGKPAFHQFIREYSKGKELEQVLKEVYGFGLEELEAEWQAHLRFRFSWLPLIFSATSLWFVITLIFLTSYWRKKRANRLKLADWEREEEDWG